MLKSKFKKGGKQARKGGTSHQHGQFTTGEDDANCNTMTSVPPYGKVDILKMETLTNFFHFLSF